MTAKHPILKLSPQGPDIEEVFFNSSKETSNKQMQIQPIKILCVPVSHEIHDQVRGVMDIPFLLQGFQSLQSHIPHIH